MRKTHRIKWLAAICCAGLLFFAATSSLADENLSVYTLKGYGYVFSPLVVDGLHFQTGAIYSSNHKNALSCRGGYFWETPVGVTYGDGDWWEASATTHWAYWKNTSVDVDESGVGDLYLGGKVRLLGQDRDNGVDLSVMPFVLFPVGARNHFIGDLYRYNPTDERETVMGLNLLLGHRWQRFYLAANIGLDYMDANEKKADDTGLFLGLAVEYQINEILSSYIEYRFNENKTVVDCPECNPCFDEDYDQDLQEIGLGLAWLTGRWGFKFHAGFGLTAPSPDFRVVGLVNRSFDF